MKIWQKKEITNEHLASLIQKGLVDMDKKITVKIDSLDKKIDKNTLDFNTKVDDLARMMQEGFIETDKRIDAVDQKVNTLQSELKETNTKVNKVHGTVIHYMGYQSSGNEEFEARLAKIESIVFEKEYVQ